MDKILIADDHPITRVGITQILRKRFTTYGFCEAGTGEEVLEQLRKNQCNLLILDMQFPDTTALDLLPVITVRWPRTPVLIYTNVSEATYGKRFLQLGVKGVLHKQASEAEVLRAVEMVLTGRTYVSTQLSESIINAAIAGVELGNPFDKLSNREMEVLHGLLKGKAIKDIAGILDVKHNTIVTYKARIYEKIGVHSLAELIKMSEVYNMV